ncbi:MAG: MFS transporter, partial [Gemmatimonadetes bacterium]|nr:MFS transporter [Gemmatimonadota bacterium]
VTDAYVGFLPPLLPELMDKHSLSIAKAATLTMLLSLATSLPQPVMGYWADRVGRKPFVIFGPALSAAVLALMGWAPSYVLLILLLVVGGLGAAAFHPPGASLATRVTEGRGSGVRLSVFSFGGAAGYALGPGLAIWTVSRFGLEGLWVAMIPGLLIAALLWPLVPGGSSDGRLPRPPRPRELLTHLKGPLGLLFGISALAAFVQRTFLTLEPIIIDVAGGSQSERGLALTLYLGAQAVGTLTSGFLTDRMDRGKLLVVLTLLATPAHLLAFSLPHTSIGGMLAIGAAGFLNMAMLPPIVVMAQEIIPAGAAVGSGIVMGLAWSVASLALIIPGWLGDLVGPLRAGQLVTPVLLLGTLLALHPSLRGRPGEGLSGG